MDPQKAEALSTFIKETVPPDEPFVVLCLIDDFPAVMGSVIPGLSEVEQKAQIASFMLKMLMTMSHTVGANAEELHEALAEVKRIYTQRKAAPYN